MIGSGWKYIVRTPVYGSELSGAYSAFMHRKLREKRDGLRLICRLARWVLGIMHFGSTDRGKTPREKTAEDGLATLLVAEAIYQSAAEGRQVTVKRPADVLRNN